MKKILFLVLGILLLAKNYNLPKSVLFSSHSWINYRDKNVEKQNFDYSCGSASLATILHYFYNKNIKEKDVLKYFFKNKKNDEVSFLDLSNAAKYFGFKAEGIEIKNINLLKKLKIPVIIYLNLGGFYHFSVLKKVKNYKVYLADPTFGNTVLPFKYFEKIFFLKKGYMLLILPKNKNIDINWDFVKIRNGQDDKIIDFLKFKNDIPFPFRGK
ncbi:C39 family peptidase [Caminibacter pacificus]|uniref:Peptidase C39 domain-containing protein n=1 Tax=Caminibacter pacificus TaxID=1424653 RepID=A0AAJ4UXJ8_9BACT|nr:cysteine peptidase family C39 domain-containing protein [Caminibacter pacificus]QCI28968.1 hypothetical protein C6V80_08285 [Caminibacter pacificus]ROR39558.1 hypothetical protein EDC58_1500 [Caminibacter pacificus]